MTGEPLVPWKPRADTFDLETPAGRRRVELRPDGFRGREIRLVIDGRRRAVLPYPKPESPYHELDFELDGLQLVAVVWLPQVGRATGEPLGFDLLNADRSVVDGRSLEEVRQDAPRPSEPAPRSFQALDIVLRVAPASAIPGLTLGIVRGADAIGWSATIGLLALLTLAIALATQVGSRGWRRIRGRSQDSVRRRATLGSVFIIGTYTAMLVVVVAGLAIVRASVPNAGSVSSLPRNPCEAATVALERSGPPATSTTWTTNLSHLILSDPGVPATIDFDGPLSLSGAARTRADPDARSKLEAAGFVKAYQRTWNTADGHVLFAEIFEFRDSPGAMQFHRQTLEYSCRFSNEAFEGPFPASVGQQLRYSGAESIVDQVHWVDGPYRIIVFHSFASPPADHGAVLALAQRAARRLLNNGSS